MPNHSLVRIVGLLAIAGTLSGCASFWSWPFPRIVQNTEGLGTSPIGKFLRKASTNHTEDGLKAATVEFIKAETFGKRLSRNEAEALGMQCAPAPSTECTYSGELWYRLEGLAPSSPHYGKRTIENIDVRFSYLKPQQLVLQMREHDIPEE